ncbi:hypothetical protein BDP81DRAFT_425672 [Colletotrichum phormii]|uniref:Uncharacterized protein n=1 Tax=Colletotrichum phormii TaxID=359342 RepID=A0AAJ0EG30_9PEZI|nr:uncharacterized protein BDP81DRAFT_425672 [Colletotrichum phormii]KAK1637673.1 hypothetical protein BDP81DRAFT_425672 [Colletotrichum phormii]
MIKNSTPIETGNYLLTWRYAGAVLSDNCTMFGPPFTASVLSPGLNANHQQQCIRYRYRMTG